MEYNTQFLTNYFPLLPNDIVIDIIQSLPLLLIEELMNSDVFDQQVYYQILKDIIVYIPTGHTREPTSLGSMVGKPYPTSTYAYDPNLRLDTLPLHFTPRCIHIQGSHYKVMRYIMQHYLYLSKIEDIKISIVKDLKPLFRGGISSKIIQLPNLSLLDIWIRKEAEKVRIPINIRCKSDLNDLKRFAKILNKPQALDQVIENSPMSTSTLEFEDMKIEYHLDHLINLISLSLNRVELKSMKYLPKSLEHLMILSCDFTGIMDQYSWPPNMKSIHIERTPLSDTHLMRLSHWPNKLKNLALIGTRFERYGSLGILPPNLEYLDLTSTRNMILIDEQDNFSFPESIKILRISGIKFFDNSNFEIQFPANLYRLQISEYLSSLRWQFLPTSLTHLELEYGIDHNDFLVYNNSSLNKNWQKFTNLTHLKLRCCGKIGLMNWLPPKSLKYLDLKSASIDSLDVALFKEENKKYTNSLIILDLALSYIKNKNISPNFYLPANLHQFILACTGLNLNDFPKSCRYKIVSD
ncbi:hypothetical protein DFJ63DRAFT_311501 [Scheffersomyces coipomensis]|uniref:uncharacterized protein n=1 Tax=Scheffersomyces coipomensis TaxID=1788519 RepID=UPI00315D826C